MAQAAHPSVRVPCALLSTLVAGFLLVATAETARADPLITSLVPPAEAVPSGSTIPVGLLVANSGPNTENLNEPATLPGQLWQAEQSWSVVLTASGSTEHSVAPGQFALCAYSLALPDGVAGRVILEVSQGLSHPATSVISIATPRPDPLGVQATPQARPAQKVRYQTIAYTLQRTFADHFSPFEPVYFIYGPKAPAAKFQFSFKYRILSFDDFSEEMEGWPQRTLQFGYTQRSLWDLDANSSPFYDTSYMPSLFYQFLSKASVTEEDRGGAKWLGLQTGYQHESNGQGSVASRSLNTMYLRSGALFGRADRWHAIVQGRVFEYIGGLSDNPYLKDYRGYGEWQAVVARGSGPSLSYIGRAGKDLSHFTSQFDLNLPVKTHLLDFATYFLIQYFDGYGESLREYDRHSDTIRAGISLVR